MAKKNDEVVEQIVKKPKGKPRGGNSPVIGDNGLMVEPGDNAKFIQNAMQIAALPKVDLTDSDAVEDRIKGGAF